MQKKHSFLLIGLIYLAFNHLPLAIVTAASPSPSPSDSPSTELEDVTENLKKRLQDTLGNATPSSSPALSLRSYVGTIRDVIKDTIVVEDKDGKKNVVVAEDATILRTPGNSTIKLEDVRIDDGIIAIGTPLGEDELTGRRLIVSIDPFTPINKVTGLGTINQLGKSILTLTSSGQTVNLTVTAKSVIKSTESLSLDFSDLEVGDTVVYTAVVGDTGQTVTNLMRIRTTSASPTP